MTNLRKLNERRVLFEEGGLLGDPKKDHKIPGFGDMQIRARPASSDDSMRLRRKLFAEIGGSNRRELVRTGNMLLMLAAITAVAGLEDEKGNPVSDWRREFEEVFLEPADEEAEAKLPALDNAMERRVGKFVQVPEHLAAVVDDLQMAWARLDNFDISSDGTEDGAAGKSRSGNTSSGSAPADGQKTAETPATPKESEKSSSS